MFGLAEAQLDIDKAFDWYLHRSVRAAEAFLHELERGLAFIATNPSACPAFEAGTRRPILTKYPYSMVFRQRGERIQVVAAFDSVSQLVRHIEAFIAHWNQTARPFVWTKPASDVIKKARCAR